jgi:hypothetical protein
MDTQAATTMLDPSMDYDMVDSVKQGRVHPKIKGLAVRRDDLSETLIGADGAYPWLRTKENVARLTRLVSLMFGLARVQAGWIPNCPSYDLKTQIPARLYEDVRHVMRLRERLAQLPGGRDKIDPDPALQAFLDALGRAGDHHQFLAGLYFEVKRSLLIALEDFARESDPLYDAPTIYELKGVIPELREQLDWANAALLESRLDLPTARKVETWRAYVRELLAHIGGILGESPRPEHALPASPVAEPMGPAPEKFLGDPRMHYIDHFPLDRAEDPVNMTLREIVYHNATEWQVADQMGVIFYAMKGLPLEFFHDLARHMWDEARHSLMGMRRLAEFGYEPFRDFKWPYFPHRADAVKDWYGGLTMVGEACSFTRKHGSIEPFYHFGDPLSAQQSEIDCADERLHVTFGRKWLPVLAAGAGDKRPLPALVRELRQSSLAKSSGELGDLSEAEKAELAKSAVAFCTSIEFSLDFTVY